MQPTSEPFYKPEGVFNQRDLWPACTEDEENEVNKKMMEALTLDLDTRRSRLARARSMAVWS